jgi:anti-anti-sigma regulatory factor
MTHSVSNTEDGTRIITVHGVIADAEAAQLRTRLVDAIWRDRARHVVVELRHGVTMDSMFFGALVAADAVAGDQQATIEFHCEDRVARDQLTNVGLCVACGSGSWIGR